MKILGAFLALALLCSGALADEQLTGKLRKSYDATNAFEANFEQTLLHKESGSQEKRKGKIVFQKPLLIRWQTNKPDEEILVINDKEIWDYFPDEEVAYRYSPTLASESKGIIQALTGQASLTRDFDVKNAGTEKGLAKLNLYPRDPTPQLVEATLWVDPASGFIRRAKVIDFYGNSNDVSLTSFSPKKSADAAQFRFKPPKGVEVEDRTKDAGGKELFK